MRSLVERFWEKVEKLPSENACWVWTGAKSRGYGKINRGSGGQVHQLLHTHRVAWEFANGPIPEGLCVLHNCDNRACIRPSHLKLGSYAENNHDMAVRRRGHKSKRGLPFGVQPHHNRWKVEVWEGGRPTHLGVFTTIEEAAARAERWRQQREGREV